MTVNGNGESEKITYNYDDNGNLRSKFKVKLSLADPNILGSFSIFKAGESDNCDVSFYEYDIWNQLTKATEGNKNISYAYNGEGYRVQKSIDGQVAKYLYEADKVVLELDGAGNQTAENVYGTNLVSRTSGTETAYYLYNGHADVVALLDTAGNTMATYYYDAFGNAVEKVGDKDNPYRYAGYRYDDETDLYYLNARYYDAKIARFMTEDTYRGQMDDPLSLNLYTYVMNNPIRYWDPSGHAVATISANDGGGNGAQTSGKGAPNLSRGSSGNNVKALQAELIKEGYNIIADGVFGPKTEAAVMDYQKNHGLTVDGKAGLNTNRLLFANDDKKATDNVSNTNSSTQGMGQGGFWDKAKSWLNETTPASLPQPIKDLGIKTIPSSGDITNILISTAAGSITGTVAGKADKVEKPLNAFINEKEFIQLAPEGSIETYTPKINKNIAKIGDITSKALSFATVSLDIGNTWTADSGNTNWQRIEKTLIQGAGAVAAYEVGVASGAVFAIGLASSEVGIGIPIMGAAVGMDFLGAAVIDGAQNKAYNALGIK